MLTNDFFTKKSQEKGFTLIELMIVVAILGVLAAIAVPQLNKYRKNAFDAAAKSDLSMLANDMENYYIDNSTYSTTLPPAFQSSNGMTVSVTSVTATGYTATASHSASTDTFTWVSDNGGGQW